MAFHDLIYTATCYIPLSILLFTVVLVTPALALFPSLIRSPLLATSIPIISILVVNAIGLFLFILHEYQHIIVLNITVVLFLAAIFRTKSYINKQALQWDKNDLYLLLINFSILLPLIAFCGLSSFRSNDALASWNYWALDYYYNEIPIDTMGYPQFFSIFISYCYKILGNTEYQGVVKVLLVAFPFTIMNSIAFASHKTKSLILFYLTIVTICVFPGFLTFSFYGFQSTGHADPMLAASIAVSLLLLLKYLANPEKKEFLFFAVLCGIVASLSKQPGLLWCYFAFPALIITRFISQKKIDKIDVALLILLFIPAGIWLFGAGSRFYDNQGVITASIKEDHITTLALLKSFLHSLVKYFLLQPTLLFIFILSVIASRKTIYYFMTLVTFIIPGFILWFTFGSYNIRLGFYLLVCCGLLVAADDYLMDRLWVKWIIKKIRHLQEISPKKIAYFFLIIGSLSFITKSFTRQINLHHFTSEHIYPFNAGLSNFYHFFDNQAEFIYHNIYNNNDIQIYAVERCIKGMFYRHTRITPPPTEFTEKAVLANLRTYKPDYVFVGFCNRNYDDCQVIQKIIKNHPALLTPISIKNAQYDHRFYKLNKLFL